MIPAAALFALRVGVLGIFAPTHVTLAAGGAAHDLRLDGDRLRVDGEGRDRFRVAGAPLVEVTVVGGAEGAGRPRIVRRFRGAIEARAAHGAILLVDELPVEAYLPGTVALESAGDHPQALATQAVLARTVAVRGARHRADGFDLCDLTHCQTYRGADGEREPARRAVAATDGEILVTDGRPAEVYFTAACGGATADGADVWPGASRHLRSVACATCQRAAAAVAWEATLPLLAVDEALDGGGRLTGLTVLERGPGGMARRVRLDGVGRVLGGEEVRVALGRALGWQTVRSARFTVERGPGGALRFRGRGAGHGVGVCEAGAADLARAGLDHRAILRHYLPDATVARAP